MENANWLNKIYANVRKQKIKSCYAFINLVNKIEDAPHIYKVENTNDYFMELDGITFSFRWERKYPVSRIIEEIYSAIQVLTLLKLKEQIIDHDLLSIRRII